MKNKLVMLTLIIFVTFVVPTAWGSTESVLYAFTDANDGAYPVDSARLVLAKSGILYGTAAAGGACHQGNIFRVRSNGTESVLHSFCGSDGTSPNGSLIVDDSGTFYGTTYLGGDNNCGTVFKLSGSKFTRLHSFTCGTDGARATAGMVQDGRGNFYGTAIYGGNVNCKLLQGTGCGVVYEISASGKFKVIYTFCSVSNCVDGAYPAGDLIFDLRGNILGTTGIGGSSNDGTVFKLTKSKSGVWAETVLHAFNGNNGVAPLAGLTLVKHQVHGRNTTVIFGVTSWASTNPGNVFELKPTKAGYNFEVLYSFTGMNGDGAQPLGPLTWVQGKLFGTTAYGGDMNCNDSFGPYGCGIVFELSEKDNIWSETILHTFEGTDGNSPMGGLVADASGHLYGTTYVGGVVSCQIAGCGVVFKVIP